MFLTLVILRLSLLALPSSGALRSLLSFSGCSQASSRFQRTAGLEAIFPLWFRHVSAEQAERRALEQVLPAACTEPPSGSSSCAEVAGGAAPQPLRRSRAEINPMIAARSRSRIARSRFELGRRGWGGCSQLPGQSWAELSAPRALGAGLGAASWALLCLWHCRASGSLCGPMDGLPQSKEVTERDESFLFCTRAAFKPRLPLRCSGICSSRGAAV